MHGGGPAPPGGRVCNTTLGNPRPRCLPACLAVRLIGDLMPAPRQPRFHPLTRKGSKKLCVRIEVLMWSASEADRTNSSMGTAAGKHVLVTCAGKKIRPGDQASWFSAHSTAHTGQPLTWVVPPAPSQSRSSAPRPRPLLGLAGWQLVHGLPAAPKHPAATARPRLRRLS